MFRAVFQASGVSIPNRQSNQPTLLIGHADISVEVGDDDALPRLPDRAEEPLQRDDLRRGQIREEGLLDLLDRAPLGLHRSEIRTEHLRDVCLPLVFR